MAATNNLLAFAHIGDLHLTRADQPNFTDLLSIVAQLEIEFGDSLDFVVLPGDNADNGLPSQYRLAATALKMLSVPVHVIAGDHDMEQGSLAAFYQELSRDKLPKAVTVRDYRCLFLDISGPGKGGPDFRLGARQLGWVEDELRAAHAAGQTAIVFMHSYPADLKDGEEAQRLNALFNSYDVALVDMGHTHYNELANDGHTIFAATRSTGQIDEGPVGYSIATVDDDVVSWRFVQLADPFPLVMITTPADHRLMREPDQTLAENGTCQVRAMVFGREEVVSVACSVEDGDWTPLQREGDGRSWSGEVAMPAERLPSLTVRAVTASGRPAQHTIRPATQSFRPPARVRDGSDSASIGAWPENGILGVQLGPNRNGYKW